MYYGYNYGYEDSMMDAFATMFGAFSGIALLFGLLVGIASYVMQSMGLYTIAKRRGLNHPWFAWLPIGCEWLVGSISDQYQYLVKGQVRNRRKVLLGLAIASVASLLVMLILLVFVVANVIAASNSYNAGMIAYSLSGQIMVVLLLCIAVIVVSIVMLVFWYICMYDVFRSCDPGNGVIYLVLSIVGNVAQSFFAPAVLLGSIFLLLCRKKDDGMPPRRDMPLAQPQFRYYGQAPQEPQTYYPQPQPDYEQPKPEPKEPWENQ